MRTIMMNYNENALICKFVIKFYLGYQQMIFDRSVAPLTHTLSKFMTLK